MADWSVEVDEERNRMYIELVGSHDPEMAKESTEAVKEAARRLDPGFEVVTDISEFMPGDQEAVEYIEEGKEAVRRNGAAAAVRVMGEGSTTGQMHFERVGEDQEEYAVAVADTVEQAEKLLEKRRKQQA